MRCLTSVNCNIVSDHTCFLLLIFDFFSHFFCWYQKRLYCPAAYDCEQLPHNIFQDTDFRRVLQADLHTGFSPPVDTHQSSWSQAKHLRKVGILTPREVQAGSDPGHGSGLTANSCITLQSKAFLWLLADGCTKSWVHTTDNAENVCDFSQAVSHFHCSFVVCIRNT